MVVLDGLVGDQNDEKGVLFKRNVKALVIKVRNADSACQRNVPVQLQKEREQTLMLYHSLSNSNIEYLYRIGVEQQNI